MGKVKFKKIRYQDLNSRQKESFNFHKVAAVLADYGFTSIRITDDWESADFIAAHVDGSTFLKVQLKGRLTFAKKYMGKDLWIAFRHGADVYLYPHDKPLTKALKAKLMVGTQSWEKAGVYHYKYLSTRTLSLVGPYQIS